MDPGDSGEHEPGSWGELRLRLGRGRSLAFLLGAGVLLVIVSSIWQYARARGWEPFSAQLTIVLDVDQDSSAMNWLTCGVFLLAALSALGLSQRAARDRWAWRLVAVGLAAVSLSEAAPIHDPAVDAVARLASEGLLLALLVAAGLAAAAALTPVLLTLDRPTLVQLLVAAVVLAGAAVGIDRLDTVDGDEAERLGTPRLARVAVEELLELVAAVLALDAALKALVRR